MKPGPTAATITVRQVLDLLDNEFALVAATVARRGFAFWVGSGISLGRAPSVGAMLERALEHLRRKIEPGNPGCRYRHALDEAIRLSDLSDAERAAIPFGEPFDAWPQKSALIRSLWDCYASVLDIRVEGKADDYMLWKAVDVRAAFAMLNNPDCEHLSIAILIMEGAIADVASANWDGLIELAVERLSGGRRLLQVVVDPAHLRDPPARARLIKFHGCAIHACDDPATYRAFLTATRPQVTNWPHNSKLDALRTVLRGVATNSRTLMIGLSLQDTNLQDLFAVARRENAWPWPPAPPPQAHVFCEDRIGIHQSNMLRTVYEGAYGRFRTDIEASALIRAYAQQVLIGLVLYVLCAKLSALAIQGSGARFAGAAADIHSGLRRLRNLAADLAEPERRAFLNTFIDMWSRGMTMFRTGFLPPAGSQLYEAITNLSENEMATEPNLAGSGLPELALALSLLGRGEEEGKWSLSLPAATIDGGIFEATGTVSMKSAQIYFVSGVTAALELIKQGALTNSADTVFHSDDAWQQMVESGAYGRRSPRGGPYSARRRSEAHHVSMRRLIREALDIVTMSQRFQEEMAL